MADILAGIVVAWLALFVVRVAIALIIEWDR